MLTPVQSRSLPRQATQVLNETSARRVLFVTIGMSVMIITTFYQTLLLSSLITIDPEIPMTLDEMAAKVETREFDLMFSLRGSPIIELSHSNRTNANTRKSFRKLISEVVEH